VNQPVLEQLFNEVRLGLRPDPILTVSQWADSHRYLSNKASAEPGKWRTDRTPYLKEIMDVLSPSSPIEEVIFSKGAQIGATEASNNWIGYIIDQAPGPMLAVLPTVDLAKRTSKQRIGPLIETTPRLREKIRPARERDSGNNVLEKEFPGGRLVLTGANSAVGLRSMPARYLLVDEASAAPQDVDGEGCPLQLARARTRTFSRKKIFIISTPTIEGRCHITNLFRESDQRYYHVPCPFCQHKQPLRWSNVKWEEGRPREAQYLCESCEKLIPERHKGWMLGNGEWRSTNPEAKNPKVAGFHLSSLYSPLGWYSWGDAAQQWVEAKGKNELLRGFINTVLGEPWRDQGYLPDWKRLYRDNRENYKTNTLPSGVLFLTAAVDVQKNYLIAEIVGWGEDKQSWSVDVRTFHGDPYQDDVWKGLDKLLSEQWKHPCGISISIRMLAVDSSAFTQAVYSWARKHHPSRVMAVKGQDHLQTVVGIPKSQDVNRNGKVYYNGVKVWPVGVSHIKHEIYGWLGLEKPIKSEIPYSSGFMHFPEYDDEYFKMLISEQCVQKMTRGGGIKWEWQKLRDRNESLDLRVMNRAAACVFGLDRFTKVHWDQLKAELRVDVGESQKAISRRSRFSVS